jgi:putative phosphoesterase
MLKAEQNCVATLRDTAVRIGVVSDTHGHIKFTQQAVAELRRHNVARVLHCGDIGTAAIVSLLAPWPTDYVWGNVDRDQEELRRAILAVGHTCHERFADLTLEGHRLAVIHGDVADELQACIHDGTWQVVCHGHTHVRRWERVGSTWVLNPGAVYRARPRSIAILELPKCTCQFITLPGLPGNGS